MFSYTNAEQNFVLQALALEIKVVDVAVSLVVLVVVVGEEEEAQAGVAGDQCQLQNN